MVPALPTDQDMRRLVMLAALGLLAPVAHARVVVTDTSIVVYDPIRFVGTTAAIAPRSSPMLDSVAKMMLDDTSIAVLEIHAYGIDARFDQLVLGELRARAIVGELVRRGVSAKRLRAVGAARPDRGGDPGASLVIAERSSTGECGHR